MDSKAFKNLLFELNRLEQKVHQMDDLKRELAIEVDRQINRKATILSGLFSVLLIYVYSVEFSTLFKDEAIHVSFFASFLQMFLIGFIAWGFGLFLKVVFTELWSKDKIPGGRKSITAHTKAKFAAKEKVILIEIDHILSQELIVDSHLPYQYLNTRSLNYLIDVSNQQELDSVDAAIQLLELEIRNPKAHRYLLPDENLITYAKRMTALQLNK
ncbi:MULTISPECIES: hypothetical protein [unclassified Lactococcus]|uniref:hypothetical protein n=1 Tax=unclassified Lactococcus TaxID=2643510 RepID=UPI0011C7EC41|nr:MULTISPECIES: hypothetical protein [unclassified Lactococcus]MQW22148.1 hypothetical protein [Lactococcus sp. dk101]TXK45084.1 hypothetical protein FVP42_02410 [Lactococcus sp. dk310]TXK51136.1 hypothetical protein FVP43_02680 [Lactococcus sp. dk322]